MRYNAQAGTFRTLLKKMENQLCSSIDSHLIEKMVKMSISLQRRLSVFNEEGHIIQYVALKLFSEENAL